MVIERARSHAAAEIQQFAPFRLMYANWEKPSAEDMRFLQDFLSGYPEGFEHLGLDRDLEQQIADFVEFEGYVDEAARKFPLEKLASVAMQQIPEPYGHEVKRVLEVQLSSAVYAAIVLTDENEPVSGEIVASVSGEEVRRQLPEQFMHNILVSVGFESRESLGPQM